MEYDSTTLSADLHQSLIDMGVSGQYALRDIMRVTANNLVKFSFPATAKEGKAHIASDLQKVFNTLDDPNVLGYFNERFGDGSATQAGKLKGKKRKQAVRQEMPGVVFNWQGDKATMKSWHRRFRGSRGKVNLPDQRPAEKKGPWQFYQGMYVTRTAFNAYQRDAFSGVAKYKAGWSVGLEYLARVTGGPMRLPAFVRKQQDARGSYVDTTNASASTGEVTLINNIPYAARMTHYIMKMVDIYAQQYAEKITKKQADEIARRFNERKLQGAA